MGAPHWPVDIAVVACGSGAPIGHSLRSCDTSGERIGSIGRAGERRPQTHTRLVTDATCSATQGFVDSV